MEQVPAHARPAIIFTARAAIQRSVQQMVQRNVINGKSFQDESDALRELHLKRLYEQMFNYYAHYAYSENGGSTKQQTMFSFFGAAASTPQVFPMPSKIGEFKTGIGAGFLREVYLADFKSRQKHLACHLASIGGRVLAGDHTFQTAKHVTEVSGAKSYEAVFDMNNEFGQITCLLFTATKSMDEIAPQLQQLNEAWEQLGVQVSFRCFYCCYCSLCCVFHVNYFQQVINFNLAELNLIVALLF
jgi:hypothetical protein